MTPHRSYVLGQALAVGTAMAAVVMLVDHNLSLSLPSFLPHILGAVSGLAGGFYATKDTTRARTHTAVIDRLLKDYDPVDKEAYRELQGDVSRCGWLKRELVEAWMAKEVKAVQGAIYKQAGPELSFLKKQI